MKGNPITSLADRIQAKRIATSYDSAIVYDVDGEPLDEEAEENLEEIREQLFDRLRKAQDKDTTGPSAVLLRSCWRISTMTIRRQNVY